MKAILTTALGLALATTASAQITNAVVQVGGPGAVGNQGGDPPTLTGGVPATGTVEFVYDSSNATLDVIVTNTAPQVPGEDNGVITEVFFNIPMFAVTGMTLTNQVGQPGGITPNFAFAFDPISIDNSGTIAAGGLGKFNCMLSTGAPTGIANPDASQWSQPLANLVNGPATFSFQCTGTNLEDLTAETFANVSSDNPPGNESSIVALKWQSAGVGGAESGTIGTEDGCPAGAWIVGDPSIGGQVTIYSSSQPGCHACVGLSVDPGPTIIGGLTIPLGAPILVIASFQFSDSLSMYVQNIPNVPALENLTVYAAAAMLDPNSGEITISEQISFTVTL